MAKKKKMSDNQRRTLRTQQIIFSVLAILIILSMVVSLMKFN